MPLETITRGAKCILPPSDPRYSTSRQICSLEAHVSSSTPMRHFLSPFGPFTCASKVSRKRSRENFEFLKNSFVGLLLVGLVMILFV